MSATIEELPRQYASAGKRIYKLYIDYETDLKPPFYSTFEVDERYRVDGVLGSGTFGLVCLATDTSNGEDVAIKKLENFFRNEFYAERAIREVGIHSQITHPFVVTLKAIMQPVNDYSFDDIYIVMETMEYSLHQCLVSKRKSDGSGAGDLVDGDLNVKLIMNQRYPVFALCQCSTPRFEAQQHPVERDLRTKICDFGLARITAFEMTQKVVSAPYRPPELFLRKISDQSNYGAAVDIWSLGCVFADMLLGKPMSLGFLDTKDDLTNLVKIAETVAPPNDEDELLDFIDSEAGLLFVKTKLPRSPTRSLRDIFRHVPDKKAVDLLEKMLVFNPGKRISIADALQHEYMAEITVDVLARKLNLKPSEVQKLNNINPPPIEMNVKCPSDSSKRACLKSLYDASVNFQPGL